MPSLLITTTVPLSIPFFLPFADHFRAAGWRVDALTGTLEGFTWRDRFDAVHAVEWSRDPRALGRVARAARRVRAVVAAGGYDLVHVHTPVASFVTRLALRGRRGPRPQVVYTAHGFHFHRGGTALRNAAFLSLEKLAGRWTDWLVVINREDEAAVRRWRIVPEERLRWMPGIGVDLRAYGPEAVDRAAVAALRAELGLGDRPAVLMVAELGPGKRPLDLLRAFAAAAERAPAARAATLLFAGRGALADAVRREAAALGVAHQVRLLGLRPDVPVLLRAASVLVLPSDREGLPRCVLEAMAMGVPVVGTRVRGTTELLEEGCGVLVDVGDVQAIADGIAGLLSDPARAATMAARARDRVRIYDERVVVRMHEALYADALATAGAAGATAGAAAARGGAARTAPPDQKSAIRRPRIPSAAPARGAASSAVER